MLTDVVSHMVDATHGGDSDDEHHHHGKGHKKDGHQMELEMERHLRIKREQEKRKDHFKDKICDLVDNEEDRDRLIDGFENKMRSLDHMLKSEADRQQEALAAKLAARKARKKDAIAEVQDKTRSKIIMID
jgi:hypothetical protein